MGHPTRASSRELGPLGECPVVWAEVSMCPTWTHQKGLMLIIHVGDILAQMPYASNIVGSVLALWRLRDAPALPPFLRGAEA